MYVVEMNCLSIDFSGTKLYVYFLVIKVASMYMCYFSEVILHQLCDQHRL